MPSTCSAVIDVLYADAEFGGRSGRPQRACKAAAVKALAAAAEADCSFSGGGGGGSEGFEASDSINGVSDTAASGVASADGGEFLPDHQQVSLNLLDVLELNNYLKPGSEFVQMLSHSLLVSKVAYRLQFKSRCCLSQVGI